MPKTPKPSSATAPKDIRDGEHDDPSSGEKRSYYYDDAHGYETFVPDLDDDVEESEDEKKPGQ